MMKKAMASAYATTPLDDNIDGLQEARIAQHVAAHRDDVRDLAGRYRAGLVADAHRGRGIVRRRADRAHGWNPALAHPEVDLLPGCARVQVARRAGAGAEKQEDLRFVELAQLVAERRAAAVGNSVAAMRSRLTSDP
jgi:hypothetical protein